MILYTSNYLSTYLFFYRSGYVSKVRCPVYPKLTLNLRVLEVSKRAPHFEAYPPNHLSIHLSIYLSVHPSIYLSFLSINLSIYLSIYLSIHLSIYLFVYLVDMQASLLYFRYMWVYIVVAQDGCKHCRPHQHPGYQVPGAQWQGGRLPGSKWDQVWPTTGTYFSKTCSLQIPPFTLFYFSWSCQFRWTPRSKRSWQISRHAPKPMSPWTISSPGARAFFQLIIDPPCVCAIRFFDWVLHPK